MTASAGTQEITLKLHRDKSLLEIVLAEKVSLSSCEKHLLQAAEMVKRYRIRHLAVDGFLNSGMDAGCRSWIRNELFGKVLSRRKGSVKKIYVVQPDNIPGRLYGKAVLNSLQTILPHQPVQLFDSRCQLNSIIRDNLKFNSKLRIQENSNYMIRTIHTYFVGIVRMTWDTKQFGFFSEPIDS